MRSVALIAMGGAIASELAQAGFADAVEVGRGGSGVVYRCYQTSLRRSVAIKVLASDLDEGDRERFLREGVAMGALSGHPNIVNILQVGMTETNRPFIVMPYHAAGSLAERVRREGRIGWPEALKIGVKLCGALETAHRADTLHRDIKPANVLVNDYGEPQLSDFGTARIAGGYQTVTGFFTGTLSYTAPEVLAGNPPTVAADVYSLGATLFAVSTGRPMADLYLLELDRFRDAGLSEPLARLAHACTRRRPTERPRRASDVAAHLRELVASGALGSPDEPPSLGHLLDGSTAVVPPPWWSEGPPSSPLTADRSGEPAPPPMPEGLGATVVPKEAPLFAEARSGGGTGRRGR